MKRENRLNARKQLDKRLNPLRMRQPFERPSRGWVKAIRESLGMTTTQFAKRLGITQPAAIKLETSEKNKLITLNRLERAAQALNCRLVYMLIPEKELQETVKGRAETLAQKRLEAVKHTMVLEDQSANKQDTEQQLKRLTKELIEFGGSELWEEDDASTPLTDEEREQLIPSYITQRHELNDAEQINILKGQKWAFSRNRSLLVERYLMTLHKKSLGMFGAGLVK